LSAFSRSVRGSNTEGRNIAWSFLKENLDKIKAMLGNSNPSLMDAVIVSCAGGFCSEEKADEIEAFFKANPQPKSQRKLQQTIENMRSNAKFFKYLVASDLSKTEFWASI
jgi:puromycin-sensitive aminopeptidase